MNTLVRAKDTGVVVSCVRVPKSAPSFPNQEFTPTSYVFDEELNEWVSIYFLSDDGFPHYTSGGAQCVWFDNGAQQHNANEFGIKLTSINLGNSTAKIAAYAMYQRQQVAADRGVAPPVHGMCCFKWYDTMNQMLHTFWGYLSSVADTEADVSLNADSEYEYRSYVMEIERMAEKMDAIIEALDELDITHRQRDRIVDSIYEEVNFVSIDDIPSFEEWCHDNDMEIHDLDDLRNGLNDVSIAGLQHDWSPINCKFDAGATLGGDLHRGNVADWQGNIVCIDFGFHCVEGAGRSDYVIV